MTNEGNNMSANEVLEICSLAGNLFDRGYAFGSTGNLSVRVGTKIWITPTGESLKGLTRARLARVDMDGRARNRNTASKELPFHLAIYRSRPDVNAIVHLHAAFSVALSCLDKLDSRKPLPALTPYYCMRVEPLGVIPYYPPGSRELAGRVGRAALRHNCLLLRNHGSICVGASLRESADRAEELEQSARLFFLLRGQSVRELSRRQIQELRRIRSPRPF